MAEATPHVPDSPAQLMTAGKAAMARGDDVRAEHYITLAQRRGYPAREAIKLLMELCVRGSRLSAALQHAHGYLREHADDVELRFVVASLHDALGQTSQATRELSRALTTNPGFAPAHFLAADIFLRQGRELVRARFHAERYLELDPSGNRASEAAAMLEMLSERIPEDV